MCQIEMPKYQCHKKVWALKIAEVKQVPADQPAVHKRGDWLLVPTDSRYSPIAVGHDEFVLKHSPKAGGYYVVYEGGYASYSPAEAFEGGHILISNSNVAVGNGTPDNLLKAREENEFLRWHIKRIELHFEKMMLVMQAAVIEAEHGEGVKAGMDWIVNTLAGPGEFAPEEEKDAQAYFDREADIIDAEIGKCLDFFRSRRETGSDGSGSSHSPSAEDKSAI